MEEIKDKNINNNEKNKIEEIKIEEIQIEDNKEKPKENIQINKTADMKKYMADYRRNNKEKWNRKNICNECSGKYTICNHTNHLRSNKHKYALIEKENKMLQNILTKIL